nr:hypothetical protein [Tanacetum cinerariifolium]
AHPEDDDDEDPEEDPANEEEEEEEHPAPADSVVVAPTAADQAPSTKETEPFETDESAATPPPHPAYRMTARISIPAPVPMPAWSDLEIVRLLAMSSPPASPLSLWSSPSPQISFPPLPPILSPPLPVQDTDEIYMRLDDEQTERQLLDGRLNMLFRDRRAHVYTRHLMETEARMSREAWVRATNASDLVHGEITELRIALQGQVTALQGQVTALQAEVTALQGQQGLAGGPTQPELPEEASSSP